MGELLQRADAWDARVPVERYLLRCELKTARLFEAACRLGALEAGGDSATAEHLGAFGRRVGLAFQLLDDVLDISGPAERTGKHRGTDLLDGTVTLPLLLAREHDAELAALDPRSVTTPAAAGEVCDRITATGALQEARTRALAIVADAKRDLPAALPVAQRRTLHLVADGVVARYA
jgi:geranylgeranyl pyrophosphate synthase